MPPDAREDLFNDMHRYRERVLLRWRQRIADEVPWHVLPPDVVRTLFSARGRETHPTVREWGTGLGFVRDVAETHGGSAIVHSSDAMGTEFRLDLPVDASPFLGDQG